MRCSSCGKKELVPAILEKYEDKTKIKDINGHIKLYDFTALNVPIFRCRKCGAELFGNDSEDVINQAIHDVTPKKIIKQKVAQEICVYAHSGQLRDDGKAYKTHPIAVARLLFCDFGIKDDETLAAAYLHDVLEDTDVTLEFLKEKVGDEVANIVAELTNKGHKGRTRKEKQDSLIKKAKTMSGKAKLIKLADRLHNVTEMTVWNIERQKRYAMETYELLHALAPRNEKDIWQAADKIHNAICGVIWKYDKD